MNGILPLYKEAGLTSHDCVMKVRHLFKTRKVGHTGTLDPGVQGVLPICIGEATKIIPFVQTHKKVYIAEVHLGKATTTEDKEGETIAEKDVITPPSKNEIDAVLKQFRGEITQIPPLYSAVRVNGKRLYEYARENIPVERPKRNVSIYEIKRLPENSSETDPHRFKIKVTCSKGTYIRTLCVDIGKKLGYPAHMSFLERVESDGIEKAQTVTLQTIETKVKVGKQDELLLPFDYCLHHLDRYDVSESMKANVLHGQKFPLPPTRPKTSAFAMYYDTELLAIYEIHPENEQEIKPVRVFNVHKT